MTKARLIITAVVLEGRTQADVARDYGVSKGWVSKLVARDRAEGETAFQPRSLRGNIGIGRTHARTPVIILAHDLNVRVVNAATGELLRELTIDQNRDYQPQNKENP